MGMELVGYLLIGLSRVSQRILGKRLRITEANLSDKALT
jgi:hypothetical protein